MTVRPRRLWLLRCALNLVNLSTPLGLLVARLGGVGLRRGPRGLLLGHGWRAGLPRAAAFTVGDVVLTRFPDSPDGGLEARPSLLAHEERHSWQYAACLGLPFLPLYAVGAAWSWVRVGDPARGNPFERWAGLADGGYLRRAVSAQPARRPPAA